MQHIIFVSVLFFGFLFSDTRNTQLVAKIIGHTPNIKTCENAKLVLVNKKNGADLSSKFTILEFEVVFSKPDGKYIAEFYNMGPTFNSGTYSLALKMLNVGDFMEIKKVFVVENKYLDKADDKTFVIGFHEKIELK
jgi:hypothetical protein